jgi:predicted RNase H-like nuclease
MMNRTTVGRAVSRQCFALFGKIREMDHILTQHPLARAQVREGHPDVMFALANSGCAMQHSKKTTSGYAERLSVLRKLLPNAEPLIAAGLTTFRRADVARDDLVDAAILAVAADAGARCGFRGIAEAEVDACGIAMNIHYPSHFGK